MASGIEMQQEIVRINGKRVSTRYKLYTIPRYAMLHRTILFYTEAELQLIVFLQGTYVRAHKFSKEARNSRFA